MFSGDESGGDRSKLIFLTHLVYQPKSFIQLSIVDCHWHGWHHMCAPLGTGLDAETSYLVYICTYISHVHTSNI